MMYTCMHKWVPENQWITKCTHAIISCNIPVEDSGVEGGVFPVVLVVVVLLVSGTDVYSVEHTHDSVVPEQKHIVENQSSISKVPSSLLIILPFW